MTTMTVMMVSCECNALNTITALSNIHSSRTSNNNNNNMHKSTVNDVEESHTLRQRMMMEMQTQNSPCSLCTSIHYTSNITQKMNPTNSEGGEEEFNPETNLLINPNEYIPELNMTCHEMQTKLLSLDYRGDGILDGSVAADNDMMNSDHEHDHDSLCIQSKRMVLQFCKCRASTPVEKGEQGDEDSKNGDGDVNNPTPTPSLAPTIIPSSVSYLPSSLPSTSNTNQPSSSIQPSLTTSIQPSIQPSLTTSIQPSLTPSLTTSIQPSLKPSLSFPPTTNPSALPSYQPSSSTLPTTYISNQPTIQPTILSSSTTPSHLPSNIPSSLPSYLPSYIPSPLPSNVPSNVPSLQPSSFFEKDINCTLMHEYNHLDVIPFIDVGLDSIDGWVSDFNVNVNNNNNSNNNNNNNNGLMFEMKLRSENMVNMEIMERIMDKFEYLLRNFVSLKATAIVSVNDTTTAAGTSSSKFVSPCSSSSSSINTSTSSSGASTRRRRRRRRIQGLEPLSIQELYNRGIKIHLVNFVNRMIVNDEDGKF